MKRLLPVLFIVILAIGLSIGVNYLDSNTKTNEIQTAQMESVDHITLTYYYYSPTSTENAPKITMELKEEQEIKTLTTSMENWDTTDYSDKVALIISGIYEVDFENGTRVLFDSNLDEYANLIKNEKKSLIKIPGDFKDTVIKKVDEQLTRNAEKFKTEKVTVVKDENLSFDIIENFAFERIFENCKNIVEDKMIDEKNFEKNFEINFNNGIRIEVSSKKYIGKLYQDGRETYTLVRLPVELVDLMENRLNNIQSGKIDLLQTNYITIDHAGVTTEVTELEKIQAIVQRLAYSKISHLNYLDSEGFKIEVKAEDYAVNFNGMQIVIYGSPTYGSRQIIYQDGSMDDITFMKGLEEYMKSLVIS